MSKYFKKITIEKFDVQKHMSDVQYTAQNLRKVDVMELTAIGYTDISEALKISLEYADISFIAKASDGKPFCIFGLSMLLHEEYGRAVWGLCTDDMFAYKREFVHYSGLILSDWVRQFGQLYNYIDVRNKQSIRWLKWLGAEFSQPLKYGVNEEDFVLFLLKNSNMKKQECL